MDKIENIFIGQEYLREFSAVKELIEKYNKDIEFWRRIAHNETRKKQWYEAATSSKSLN